MRITQRSALAIATAGIAAVALTACSSSSSSESSSPPASESASTAPSQSASAAPTDAASASVDPSASASTTMPDVCAALSVDEIKAVIGADPGVPVPGQGTCIYPDVQLNLGIAPAALYDTTIASAKTDTDVTSIVDITGVGEKGAFATQTDGSNVVLAVQGDYIGVAQSHGTKEQLSALVTELLNNVN